MRHVLVLLPLFSAVVCAAKPAQISDATRQYLDRIFAPGVRQYAFDAADAKEAAAWRAEARPVLQHLLGLDRIRQDVGNFQPQVQLDAPEDFGDYTRQTGTITSEPAVTIPFYLFRPKGAGPFPLGIFPHGHGEWPLYAGIAQNEAARAIIDHQNKDVAVQAVKQGILAIAPATRGLGAAGVPDVSGRFGKRDCRSQAVHCIMAGRSAVGERVWDLQRLLDWASKREDVDARRVLVLGNSGGGVVTLYTAAVDTRVSMAVCCGAFTLLIRSDGHAHHCDCNTVPGIMTFGDFPDVAGLIAPRPFLTVNGQKDGLFLNGDVDEAAARLMRIYAATGAPGKYEHHYGAAGHQFYPDLMWPYVVERLPLKP